MKPQTPPSELALAFDPLKPVLIRAAVFSMIISLFACRPRCICWRYMTAW
jgi:ATP-binding cassette, subfamily C, bacterial exporter for protease/lipase